MRNWEWMRMNEVECLDSFPKCGLSAARCRHRRILIKCTTWTWTYSWNISQTSHFDIWFGSVRCPSCLDVEHKQASVPSYTQFRDITHLRVVITHDTFSLWISQCILTIPPLPISPKSWSLGPEILEAVLLIIWVIRSIKFICGLANFRSWGTLTFTTVIRIICRITGSPIIFKLLDLTCPTRSLSKTWRYYYLLYQHRSLGASPPGDIDI